MSDEPIIRIEDTLLAANNTYLQGYEESLVEPMGNMGMDYLHKRGFTDETIREFHIGYASQDNNAFAGRVIFPWFDVKGNVIAFSGRKIDDSTTGFMMKYKDSPDNLIYCKGHELWGLYQAKYAILKANEVFIVEGFFDVMKMHQEGIKNVVSCSGCSLSKKQIALLSRFTQNVTLLHDSDKAGIMAAKRAIPILLERELNVDVVLLPDGEDPDSFARQHTTDEVKEYITEHKQNFVAFMSNVLLEGNEDIASRANAVKSILANISLVKDSILRELYIKELAKVSGIQEKILKESNS